jgi:hypothetical protein
MDFQQPHLFAVSLWCLPEGPVGANAATEQEIYQVLIALKSDQRTQEVFQNLISLLATGQFKIWEAKSDKKG